MDHTTKKLRNADLWNFKQKHDYHTIFEWWIRAKKIVWVFWNQLKIKNKIYYYFKNDIFWHRYNHILSSFYMYHFNDKSWYWYAYLFFFLMKYFMKIFSYICELIKCLNDISLISICKFYYFLKYVCNSNKMDIIRCWNRSNFKW